MNKIKRIGVFSFAKFQALLATLIGLFCGILYSFGGLIIDALVSCGLLSPVSMLTPGLSFRTVLAFGALMVCRLYLVLPDFFWVWLKRFFIIFLQNGLVALN